MRTAKTLIRLGGCLAVINVAQYEAKTADAQADLSLRWAHTHCVGFVVSRLNYDKILYCEVHFLSISLLLLLHCATFITARHKLKAEISGTRTPRPHYHLVS